MKYFLTFFVFFFALTISNALFAQDTTKVAKDTILVQKNVRTGKIFGSVKDKNTQEIDVLVYGIPRYPAQLFEAISSFLLFILLYALYKKYGKNTPEGLLFGLFVVILFSLRFFYEIFKCSRSNFIYITVRIFFIRYQYQPHI